MALKTKIQWTDHTWNPWHGCHKVSAGCKYCYMFRDKERYKQDPNVVLRSKTNFFQPLTWKRQLETKGPDGTIYPGMKIFPCSWSDFLIEEADQWRTEAWPIIRDTPFIYQCTTKRIDRIAALLPPDWGSGYPNFWLGVSVENMKQYQSRVETLIQTTAAVRWLSIEPMLEAIDFDKFTVGGSYYNPLHGFGEVDLGNRAPIHWVVIGGESGNDTGKYRYRPCELEWIESVIEQCKNAGIPVFVKQLGTYLAKKMNLKSREGGDWEEWPDHLKVREFPNVKLITHDK